MFINGYKNYSSSFRTGGLQRTIITAVNAGLVMAALGVALSSPYGTQRVQRELNRSLLRYLHEKSEEELDEEKVRRSLYNLKKQKFIRTNFSKDGKTVYMELTAKGRGLLGSYEFYDMKINPQKKWDGKWRIVLFDIPEKHRYARDILRDKLKRLGFFQIQKSVWAYPHPCKEEIRFIAEFLYIENYVLIFEDIIEPDERLVRYFERKKLM